MHSPAILSGNQGAGGVGESVGDQSLVDEVGQGLVLQPVSKRFETFFQFLPSLLLHLSLIPKLQTLLCYILQYRE